jgi:hypothetical protein
LPVPYLSHVLARLPPASFSGWRNAIFHAGDHPQFEVLP